MKNVVLEGLKIGIRFQTSKGLLTTEQLFQLSMTELSSYIKEARKIIKSSESEDEELDFLSETSVSKVDKVSQLRFDILKEVYTTRREDLDAAKTSRDNREHNTKILALIAEKKDGELAGKSIEELEKMLK